MAKKRSSRQLEIRHVGEEEEIPSLMISDTSRSAYENSSSCSSDNDNAEGRGDALALVPVQRRSRRSTPPHNERHQRPQSRSRSRPRPPRSSSKAKLRSSKSNRNRFSYSRRSSIGGSTLYETHHMATLDTYLRSTSGLRLQTDGSCNFLFEDQKFIIEITEETGDFLFYANLGPLKELQRRNRPANLLRLLATWNEELKQDYYEKGSDGQQENSGLLRIDSTKPEGPLVAFIFYGRVDDMKNAAQFNEALDDFVDDALEFADRLHGHGVEKKAPEPIPEVRPKAVTRDMVSNNNARQHQPHQQQHQHMPTQNEAATLAPPMNPVNSAITSTDIYNATLPPKKPSVFSKMIQSIRSKSNNSSSDNIGSLAFIDPSNPNCAFVVDKNAAEEGGRNIKPTIVLSRKGGSEKRVEDGRGNSPTRKGSSFHGRGEEKQRPRSDKGGSFHDRRKAPSSFHTNNEGISNDHAIRSKSFNHSERKRSSYLSEAESDYERSNQSIDILDHYGPNTRGPAPERGGRFHQSDPIGASRRRSAEIAAENEYLEQRHRSSSRRHSAGVPRNGSGNKPSVQRHSLHDDGRGAGVTSSKARHHGHSRNSGRQ